MSTGLMSCTSRPLSWVAEGAAFWLAVGMLVAVVFAAESKTLLIAAGDCASRLLSCGMGDVALVCGCGVLIAGRDWGGEVKTAFWKPLGWAARPSSSCGKAAAVAVVIFMKRMAVRRYMRRCIMGFCDVEGLILRSLTSSKSLQLLYLVTFRNP